MRTLFLLILLSIGCDTTDTNIPRGERASAQRVLVDGTPEADGVIGMLNDASTTFDVLDEDARLNRRAAENLIAHRDGPDGVFGTGDDDFFDDVAEIDDVKYVGDSAMQQLLDYARENGWISEDSDFYGRIEGVDFTNEQATATLRLANTASQPLLDDDVALDSRAAENIVQQRPFDTIEALGDVGYVGESALTRMRDFAVGWDGADPNAPIEGPLSTTDAVKALEDAVVGLMYPSEADHSLTVVTLEGISEINASNAKTLVADIYEQRAGEVLLEDKYPEAVSLSRVFGDLSDVDNPWFDDQQRADAVKWAALEAIFTEQLEDAVAIRIGEYLYGSDVVGSVDIYVFGVSTDDELVGFHTISVVF